MRCWHTMPCAHLLVRDLQHGHALCGLTVWNKSCAHHGRIPLSWPHLQHGCACTMGIMVAMVRACLCPGFACTMVAPVPWAYQHHGRAGTHHGQHCSMDVPLRSGHHYIKAVPLCTTVRLCMHAFDAGQVWHGCACTMGIPTSWPYLYALWVYQHHGRAFAHLRTEHTNIMTLPSCTMACLLHGCACAVGILGSEACLCKSVMGLPAEAHASHR